MEVSLELLWILFKIVVLWDLDTGFLFILGFRNNIEVQTKFVSCMLESHRTSSTVSSIDSDVTGLSQSASQSALNTDKDKKTASD